MIVTQILYNLSIIIAFTVFSDSVHRLIKSNKQTAIIFQGILFGIASVIAMMNPFVLSEGLIFDGRSIVLSLCTLFFGPIAGLISLAFSLTYRAYIGGSGLIVGELVSTASVLIGMAFRYYIINKNKALPSIIQIYFMGIIVHIAMLSIFLLLPAELRTKTINTIAITVIIFFPIATVLIGVVIKNQLIYVKLLNQLEVEHEKLAITLNSLGDGVISIDKNGRVMHLNSMAEIMCEMSEKEALNMPLEDVLHITQGDDNLQVDLLKKTLDEVKQLGEAKLLFENIYLNSLSQKKHHIVCNISPIINRESDLDGAVILFSDLSEQDEMQNSLNQSEAMFKAVFDSSASAIVILNIDGYFSTVNNAFTNILGYSPTDLQLQNKTFKTITHPEDIEKSNDFFKHLVDNPNELIAFEKRFITADNHILWGLVTSSVVIDKKGNPRYVVSQIVDITKRKLDEAELKNQNSRLVLLTKELSEAKDRAEKSDDLKTAFLSNLSHEIRTPMNGILGVADLLIDEEITKDERENYNQIIHSSCNRLLNTINDIIDASKIELNQIQFFEIGFTINELIRDLSVVFQPLFEEKNIAFSTDIDPSIDRDARLVSDYDKLKQILSKLLSNAHKFTFNGSVCLSCKLNSPYYYFEVKDTGVGISEEYAKLMFANFSQEDVSMNRGYEGSGLGLVIARGFARALNGDLTAVSEKNVGSAFSLKIPLYSQVKEKPNLAIIDVEQPVELKFLIAEDDEVSFILAEKILTREFGARVIRAKNGVEALDIFTASNDINLILMDVKMPVMDGLECVKRLRKINEDVPIIAVTAFAFAQDQQYAIEVGCNDYISKPYNASLLIQKIRSFVG